MRSTRLVLLVVGVLMLVLGALGMLWATSLGSYAGLGVGSGAGALIVTGVILFFASRFVGRLDPTATLANGVPGTAQVLGVRDTGVIVNNRNLVVEVRMLVQVPGREPYEAVTKVPLGRTQWGAIQPGMTLPVKVDPADPQRVVVDPERPASTAGASPFGGVQTTTMSAASIVAAGVAATARLLAVEPTGLTAGAVAPGLAPGQADDPVVKLAFTYLGADGREVHVENMVRVPDGKAGFLATGREVPIRYLPDAPTTATIDWDRLV